MGSGLQGLCADGGVQGINIRFHGVGALRRVSVGQGIGILGFMAGAGAYQADQSMFEIGIVIQKRFVLCLVFLYYKLCILRQHIVQLRLFLLDLLDQADHGIIVRGYNVT